jgi:dTDP-4-dehydrorhamnose 3,5-epimerase
LWRRARPAREGRRIVEKEFGMIEGVKVKKLKVIPDERGLLMEMMRDDDEFFQKFGQVYLSVVYPGVVKGWHYHKKQTDHFVFVKGMAKVVLYDTREQSKTKGEVNEFFMGEQNPILLVIPPFVLHGMKGIGVEPAYLVNTPTEHYIYNEPDEFRMDPHSPDVPYDWSRKDG